MFLYSTASEEFTGPKRKRGGETGSEKKKKSMFLYSVAARRRNDQFSTRTVPFKRVPRSSREQPFRLPGLSALDSS